MARSFLKLKYRKLFVAMVISAHLLLLIYLKCSRLPVQDRILSFLLGSKEIEHYSEKRQISFNRHCREQKNFVFIKGMKSATSTLLGVFYRFGYTRNLTFVSPLDRKIYLNWPFPITVRDFRPSSKGYNILTDHSIYTEDVMKAIMPNDTVYISIIRQPFAQLKSIFQYFRIAKSASVPKEVGNPVVEYFSHLEKYESVFKAAGNKERWCIPDHFSMTKNLMSHCFGMPLGFPPGTKNISNSTAAVQQYIQKLDTKFSLIMIAEFFYESLILLRRLMCWSFRDIVFMDANIGVYSFKETTVPEFVINLHRKWSSADYMLYNYFNSTFWKHVSQQGSDFYSEVNAFKAVEEKVRVYCHKLYSAFKRNENPRNMTEMVIEETRWSNKFSIRSGDCWMLGPNPYELIYTVQNENDKREARLLNEQKKVPDNRTMKGLC